MIFPRVTAILSVFLLIAVIALLSIGAMNALGSQLTHGPMTSKNGATDTIEHSDGVIRSIDANHTLVLIETNGQIQDFKCSQHCLTTLSHIQRHINEHAHTDIYYVRLPDNTLEAIDVD